LAGDFICNTDTWNIDETRIGAKIIFHVLVIRPDSLVLPQSAFHDGCRPLAPKPALLILDLHAYRQLPSLL
jgi:hypothetical protein